MIIDWDLNTLEGRTVEVLIKSRDKAEARVAELESLIREAELFVRFKCAKLYPESSRLADKLHVAVDHREPAPCVSNADVPQERAGEVAPPMEGDDPGEAGGAAGLSKWWKFDAGHPGQQVILVHYSDDKGARSSVGGRSGAAACVSHSWRLRTWRR